MKNYNIVWIMVDSVRKYYSDDDRSRIKIMDKFAENAIEFKNIVTSAPSTIMSISSMMTSAPAYHLGRTYDEYWLDKSFFTNLPSILKKHGWINQSIIMLPEIREKLNVLDHLEKKYWPKNYSHKDNWNNKDVFKILKNTLEKQSSARTEKPYFWFLDFNCRQDKETSNIVEDSIDILEKYSFNKDNTIFVLCSDHGYPDPSSGITPELLKKQNLTHDLFMTDDNIMIPLILSYPGCKKNHKVSSLFSTLDIMPTILDLLEIDIEDHDKKTIHGTSLLNKINEKDILNNSRKVRVDARFLNQDNRVSALRNNNHKIVYFHDTQKYELFSVGQSHLDEKKINIEDNLQIFNEFKTEFMKTEELAFDNQVNYSIYKLKDKIYNFDEKSNILIIYEKKLMSDLLEKVIRKLNKVNITKLNVSDTQYNNNKRFEIVIIVGDVSSKNLKNLLNKINYKKKFFLDSNMNTSNKLNFIIKFLRNFSNNRKLYTQEPTLIFWLIKKIFIKMIKKVKLN